MLVPPCSILLTLMIVFLTGSPNSDICKVNLSKANVLCSELGVPLVDEKTFGPSTVITFLGIELEESLPKDKLLKAKEYSVKFWISIRSAMKRNLLSLIGYLHHCCKVIVPALPFLRHLIDLSVTVKDLDCNVHLSIGVKCDLVWWDYLLENWNGKSFFLMQSWQVLEDLDFTSDAATNCGCAAILGNSWFALR